MKHQLNLVGKKPNSDKLSPTEFKIDEKQNKIVKCPNDREPKRSDFSKGIYSAHFDKERCKDCPLNKQCLIKAQKKDNVVRFSQKTYKTEQVRKEMSTDEYKAKSSKRAGIEGIPSALRRGYDVDRMPVRGLLRSKMHFGFKILALNVKRLKKGLDYMEKSRKETSLDNRNHVELSKLKQIYQFIKIRVQNRLQIEFNF